MGPSSAGIRDDQGFCKKLVMEELGGEEYHSGSQQVSLAVGGPTDEADCLYKLLKAIKPNKSFYRLLGESTMILRALGPAASPEMKKKLATAVNFHTSFQMCINHVPLRGLVESDKEIELVRIVDDDRDVQESVKLTVCQILFWHQVIHLPSWQSLLQNDNGSWRGYYSNGKGCHSHKGAALMTVTAKYMLKMRLMEATHQVWGTKEPHTYFHGTELIDGVWHSHNLDVTSTLQVSFHEGVGDH